MTVIYYITVILITVVLMSISLLLFLITKPFDSKGLYIHIFSRLWAKIFTGLQPGWKIKVEGLENVDPNETYVIIVNHQSMLDIPLMYALPLNFKWLAKEEVHKVPLFGWMMRLHGDITIKRGSSSGAKRFISECSKWINKEVSVIIFPEGTRSKNGKMRRFKEGAFILAKNCDVAILPCVIDGSGEAVIDSWHLRRKQTFLLKVLPPISKNIVRDNSSLELSKLIQAQMVHEHNVIVENRNIKI